MHPSSSSCSKLQATTSCIFENANKFFIFSPSLSHSLYQYLMRFVAAADDDDGGTGSSGIVIYFRTCSLASTRLVRSHNFRSPHREAGRQGYL